MAEQLDRYATYLWQEQKRHPYYRIQTTDHRIARKLKKRQNCNLVGHGINTPLWIFNIKYSSPRKALKGLANITRRSVEKSDEKGVFVAYTLPDMDIRKDSGRDKNG